MLPTSGYFRTVDCPFYLNGLCERPYCHFRHEALCSIPTAGNLVQKWNLPVALDEVSDAFSREDELKHLEKVIQKMKEDVRRNEEELAGIRCAPDPVTSQDTKSQVMYIPTPVSKPVVGRHMNMPDTSCSRIPEYKPTPIAKLKKMQKGIVDVSPSADDAEYDPVTSYKTPEPVPKVKRKRTEEYDPTLVKCKPKYSISLVEESDEEGYTPKKVKLEIKDSLKVDDVLPSNEGAQFSDDDTYAVHTSKDPLEENHETELDKKSEDAAVESSKPSQFDLVQNILTQSEISIGKLKGESEKSKPASKQSSETNKVATKDYRKPRVTSSKSSQEKKDKKLSLSETKKEKSTKHSSSSSHNKDATKSKESSVKNKLPKDPASHNSDVTKKDPKLNSGDKAKDLSSHKKSCSPVKSSKDHKPHKNHESTTKNSSDKERSSKDKDTKEKPSKLKDPHKSEKSDTQTKSKPKVSSSKHSSKHSSSSSSSSPRTSKDAKKVSTHKHKLSSGDKPKSNSTSSSNTPSKPKKPVDDAVKKQHSTCTDSKRKDTSNEHCRSDSENFKVPDEQVWLAIRSNPPLKPSPKGNISSSNVGSDSDNDDSASGLDYSYIDLDDLDTDLDEHDTYEECLRIFNESNPVSHAEEEEEDNPSLKKMQRVEKNANEMDESPTLGKKRVAYQGSENIKRAAPVSRISQVQLINSRLQKVQEVYSKQEAILKKQAPNPFANSVASGNTKRRIAHVPNAALIAAATAASRRSSVPNHSFSAAANSTPVSKSNTSTPTIATTVTKGEKRVAHVPNISNRPTILAEYGSKVPTIIRQRYLNLFVDECLKFYPEEEDAFERAVAEEKNVYDRSSNKTVYLNVAVNAIKRLRHETETSQTQPVKPSTSKQAGSVSPSTSRPQPMKVSHELILAGPKAANFGYRLERNKIQKRDVEISGAKLYQLLKPYILSREQLEENGFPLPHPTEPGKAIILGADNSKKPVSSDPLSRVCDRCSKKFRVTPKGTYVVQEECVYHWGKAWKKKIAGSWETRYNCCQGDLESDGCCVAAGHVFDGADTSNVLKGFVKTLPKTPPIDGNFGVYSLDCEMCYTTAGMELTRVTVINNNLKPVFESLVKPENPILDYNTRFSGITEEDLSRVRTTIRDVQAVLLNLFNDKTILMGHSLESDFKALKLIHPTVVDTSIVFPHRRGPPLKRALKNLMGEYLNKIIQNSVDGHDSQEDAVACMELMLWKIREDLRRISR